MLFNWCRGLLRTQENSAIQLSHEMVARMPMDCQRVLGYAGAITGLGHANGDLPAKLLGPGGEELGKWQTNRALAMAKAANLKGLKEKEAAAKAPDAAQRTGGDPMYTRAESAVRQKLLG